MCFVLCTVLQLYCILTVLGVDDDREWTIAVTRYASLYDPLAYIEMDKKAVAEEIDGFEDFMLLLYVFMFKWK